MSLVSGQWVLLRGAVYDIEQAVGPFESEDAGLAYGHSQGWHSRLGQGTPTFSMMKLDAPMRRRRWSRPARPGEASK